MFELLIFVFILGVVFVLLNYNHHKAKPTPGSVFVMQANPFARVDNGAFVSNVKKNSMGTLWVEYQLANIEFLNSGKVSVEAFGPKCHRPLSQFTEIFKYKVVGEIKHV